MSAVPALDGTWKLVLDTKGAGGRFAQTYTQIIPHDSWLADDTSMSWSQAGEATTESVAVGEPVILLRLRRTKEVQTPGGAMDHTYDPDPTDGIMVWIQETTKP